MMKDISELARWLEQFGGLHSIERGYILDALRKHPQRPAWGADWTEFLSSYQTVEAVKNLIPRFPKVKIMPDMEYNAEAFWEQLREKFPAVATVLEETGEAVITEAEWEMIKCLPGFSKGPKHAPTALLETEQVSYNDLVTLTQIMAVNGDVPVNVGGWLFSEGYAGAVHRINGVLGEVVYSNGTAYVCVRECLTLSLPNKHPDYIPPSGTVWVQVPTKVDWHFVKEEYHDQKGWRVKHALQNTNPCSKKASQESLDPG